MKPPLERIQWHRQQEAYVRVRDVPPEAEIVIAGDCVMPCNFHADPEVNKARAEFIARAINERLVRIVAIEDAYRLGA